MWLMSKTKSSLFFGRTSLSHGHQHCWPPASLLVLAGCWVSSLSWCSWWMRGECGSRGQFSPLALVPLWSTSAVMMVIYAVTFYQPNFGVVFFHWNARYLRVPCLHRTSEHLCPMLLSDSTHLSQEKNQWVGNFLMITCCSTMITLSRAAS